MVLMTILKKMVSSFHSFTRSLMRSGSSNHEDKVARWKFAIMDRDRNGQLDKKELKRFRRALVASATKDERKCARNFLRYCDDDKSKKISESEFLLCLETNNIGQLIDIETRNIILIDTPHLIQLQNLEREKARIH